MYSGSYADLPVNLLYIKWLWGTIGPPFLSFASNEEYTYNNLFINMCSSVWPDKFLHCLFDCTELTCTVDSSENSILTLVQSKGMPRGRRSWKYLSAGCPRARASPQCSASLSPTTNSVIFLVNATPKGNSLQGLPGWYQQTHHFKPAP